MKFNKKGASCNRFWKILFVLIFWCLPLQAYPLHFAFIPGKVDPFYFAIEEGMQIKAKELGVNLIVSQYPKNWGASIQIPILENFVQTHKVDLIIIAPTSVDELIAPLRKIYNQGIQIITIDTFIGNGKYTPDSPVHFPLSYIGSNNRLGGEQLAIRFAKMINERGKIYINSANPEISSTTNRVQGFLSIIEQFPNIEVAGIDYNQDNPLIACQQTLKMLVEMPDINAILGTNAFSMEGVYKAIQDTGLEGGVKVVGWGATEDLLHAMDEGKIDLLLAQAPKKMGELAIEWGFKFFNGKHKIPKHIYSGFEFFTKKNVNAPAMQQWKYN